MHIRHITTALLTGAVLLASGIIASAQYVAPESDSVVVERIIRFVEENGAVPLGEECKTLLRERIPHLTVAIGPSTDVVRDPAVMKCLGGKYAYLGISFPLGTSEIEMGPLVVDEHTWYVKIPRFLSGTASTFTARIGVEKVDAIIFDVRGTLGGLTDEALGILDQFTPTPGAPTITMSGREGVVVHRGVQGAAWRAVHDAFMVVLMDHNTASAAEAFAGVLKRWYPERVVLAGSRTYGKGSYQGLMKTGPYWVAVPDGSWFIGEGATRTSVDGVGLEPDWLGEPTIEDAYRIVPLKRALEAEAAKRRMGNPECTAVRVRTGDTVCR